MSLFLNHLSPPFSSSWESSCGRVVSMEGSKLRGAWHLLRPALAQRHLEICIGYSVFWQKGENDPDSIDTNSQYHQWYHYQNRVPIQRTYLRLLISVAVPVATRIHPNIPWVCFSFFVVLPKSTLGRSLNGLITSWFNFRFIATEIRIIDHVANCS